MKRIVLRWYLGRFHQTFSPSFRQKIRCSITPTFCPKICHIIMPDLWARICALLSISSTFYTQILRWYFGTKKSWSQIISREKLREALLYENFARKMLMKLTFGCQTCVSSPNLCAILQKKLLILLSRTNVDKIDPLVCQNKNLMLLAPFLCYKIYATTCKINKKIII